MYAKAFTPVDMSVMFFILRQKAPAMSLSIVNSRYSQIGATNTRICATVAMPEDCWSFAPSARDTYAPVSQRAAMTITQQKPLR